ncbi:hypothetical protein C8R44DRAFT_895689 [Mycena epipterygia]|nr:hypothetical protein C8R44DRAFT_895689 [Mycena epipterygia]
MVSFKSLLLFIASAAITSTTGSAIPTSASPTTTAPTTLPTLPGAVRSLFFSESAVCERADSWVTVRSPLGSMHFTELELDRTGLLRGLNLSGSQCLLVPVLGAVTSSSRPLADGIFEGL